MTRRAFEAQSALVEQIRGQRCSQVSIGEDDELILDFGDLSQTGPGEFDGETWLIVECPWRLEDAESVLCGWEDDEDTITECAGYLIGLTLERTTVLRPGFDLTLTFSDEYRLRVFPDCVAYYTDDSSALTIPWYAGGKVASREG